MASSAILGPLRRRSPSFSHLNSVANIYCRMLMENKHPRSRHFSVFNEFSKHLKGEAKSSPEFQQSIKELDKKIGVAKEEVKTRTKKTAEKLYKTVDEVWTEAEAASKKISANVKEKFSAASEEVKQSFRLGKEEPSGSTSTSTCSSGVKDGHDTAFRDQNPQSSEAIPDGQADTLFDRFKSTLSSSGVSLAFKKLKETKLLEISRKGYDIIKEELSSKPRRKKFIEYEPSTTSSGVRSTKTDIVVLPSKQSRIGEKWETFKDKVKGYPAFRRIRGFGQPVQEVMEDMKDRWETSDNPVVHKIQDLNGTVFGETSTGLSFKEIRLRDPSFSMPDFVAEVQEMTWPVITAYLKGDVDTLKKYCFPELLERCKAEHMGLESSGIFIDNKVLHISEVQLYETKMVGNSPVIIMTVLTQQIHCVRDREGSITAGGKDTIHTVHYALLLQQIDVDELEEGTLYPVWKLREIHQLGGFQALI